MAGSLAEGDRANLTKCLSTEKKEENNLELVTYERHVNECTHACGSNELVAIIFLDSSSQDYFCLQKEKPSLLSSERGLFDNADA